MKRRKKENININKLILLSSSKRKIIDKLMVDMNDKNTTKKWEIVDGQRSSE